MSVVIKMDMPERCSQCKLMLTSIDYYPKCIINHRTITEMNPKWCPILCELPEKHGRLVDADDFLKFLQALTKNGAPYQSVIELLGKSETIIGAEGEHDGK